MEELIQQFNDLLKQGSESIQNQSEKDFANKPSPDKWSKKEILGHLVDSAINNLQRFTEIQFEPKPYTIRHYNQDELVKTNQYQAAETEEIRKLWLALNTRIINMFGVQNEKTLAYPVILGKDKETNLQFLMEDYVVHLAHHLRQIMDT